MRALSALRGDNVARRSDATPWYDGPTFLEALAAIRREPPPADRPLRVGMSVETSVKVK